MNREQARWFDQHLTQEGLLALSNILKDQGNHGGGQLLRLYYQNFEHIKKFAAGEAYQVALPNSKDWADTTTPMFSMSPKNYRLAPPLCEIDWDYAMALGAYATQVEVSTGEGSEWIKKRLHGYANKRFMDEEGYMWNECRPVAGFVVPEEWYNIPEGETISSILRGNAGSVVLLDDIDITDKRGPIDG